MIKVTYPNVNPTQPMNKDVHPNISGNINSTTDSLPMDTQNQDISITENNISNIVPENTNNSSYLFYVLSGLFIFLVFILVFFVYKKLKQNSTNI